MLSSLIYVFAFSAVILSVRSEDCDAAKNDTGPIVVIPEDDALRYAEAIGFEAEDAAEDNIDACKAILELTEGIYNESSDAANEVDTSDTVSGPESVDAYSYILREVEEINGVAQKCINSMGNVSLVGMAESLANMLSPGDNATKDSAAIRQQIKGMLDEIDRASDTVDKWISKMDEIAENIIAAARDALEEVVEDVGASNEAKDDAKDSKNEIKEFAEGIMEITEDMRRDSKESFNDMRDDLDKVSASQV